MVEESQHQRSTSIIHRYCNMPCLDCNTLRFATVVVKDQILQISSYTFPYFKHLQSLLFGTSPPLIF